MLLKRLSSTASGIFRLRAGESSDIPAARSGFRSSRRSVSIFAAALLCGLAIVTSASAATPPEISRISPGSPVSLNVGQSATFWAEAEAAAGLHAIEWYVGSSLQQSTSYTSTYDYYEQESFSHTFSSGGTYFVYAYVYDRDSPQQEDFIFWEVNVISPPAPPTGVSASDGTYNDRIRVTWNSSSGASSYEVWRNTSNSSGSASRILTTSSRSFDDTGMAPDTNYYYWVKARNSAGTSGFSSANSGYRAGIAPTMTRLSPGSTVSLTAGQSQQFSAAADAGEGIRVIEWYVGSTLERSTSYTSSFDYYEEESFTYTFSTAGTYTVSAYVHDRNPSSQEDFVTWQVNVESATPPPPTGVSASDGTYNDRIRVTWNSSSGASSYEVWRNTSNSSGSASRILTTSSRSFDDTGMAPDTNYYYWVKARNSAGTSGFSSANSGYRAGIAPTMTRLSPGSTVSLTAGQSQQFSAAADAGEGIRVIEWYVGSTLERSTSYTSSFDYYEEESFTYTFSTAGTYTVSAYVHDRNPSSQEDFVTWQVNVEAAQESGDLTVTVLNQDGIVPSGFNELIVERWQNGSKIDERRSNSSNQVAWSGIPTGTYQFDVYVEGPNPFEALGEYWITGFKDVVSGANSLTLQREEPFVEALSVYRVSDNQLLGASSTIDPGTEIRMEAVVRNRGNVSRSTRVRMALDRDRSAPSSWDHDWTSGYVTIAAGGTQTIARTFTPSGEGTYYRAVKTEINPGGKTDSWNWSQTFSMQTAPQAGDITVTVLNQDGSAPTGFNQLIVERWQNGSKIDERRSTSSNQVAWSGIPTGTYQFDVYVEGPNPFEALGEYWITGFKDVVSGANSLTLQREEPYVQELNVYRVSDNQLLGAGSTIEPGTEIRMEAVVRNRGSVSRSTRVRMALDRDRSAPGSWDHDWTSGYVTIAAGGTQTIAGTFTPSGEGTYYRAVKTEINPGGKTDSWNWSETFSIAGEAPVYGTTVITHGLAFGPDGSDPLDNQIDWMLDMAQAIQSRAGKGAIAIYNKNTGRFSFTDPRLPGGITQDQSGEIILLFDWAEESNDNFLGYSEAAGAALYTALLMEADSGNFSISNLHFIGHSRGTVVNSEAVQRLLHAGYAVDHVTNLDPHDWGAIEDYIFNPFADDYDVNAWQGLEIAEPVGTEPNNGAVGWKGVEWSDTYWQRNAPGDKQAQVGDSPGLYPLACETEIGTWYLLYLDAYLLNGRPIKGTYNENWTFVPISVADLTCPMTHSGVQQEYLRTIQNPDYVPPSLGHKTGFYFSRLGGGAYQRPQISESDKQPISFDTRHEVIVNGDFARGPTNDFQEIGRAIPGWGHHGGEGSGHVDQEHLELDFGDLLLVSDRFRIPSDATAITFDYQLLGTFEADDSLLAKVDLGDGSFSGPSFSAALTEPLDWRRGTISLSGVNGETVRLKLELVPSGILTDEVWIDDVKVVTNPSESNPLPPTPIVPGDEETVQALTPTFLWSEFEDGGDGESQAGFQLRVRSDTDNDAIVYDTGFVSDPAAVSHTYSAGTFTGIDPVTGDQRVSVPLEQGKHYHWHVRYRNSGGDWSSWSADDPSIHQDFYTASDQNEPPFAPAMPFPLEMAVDVSKGTALNWSGGDPDGDSVTYDVYLEAGDMSPNTIICADISAQSCSPDGELNANTDYYWYVTAQDSRGLSAQSPVWQFRTEAVFPSAPALVEASDGLYSDRVRVTWSDVADVDDYEIYRCTSTSAGDCGSAIATPAGTSFDDFGASADVVYYYRIKACSAAEGCSGFSSFDAGRRQGQASPPPPPGTPIASDNAFADRVRVSWSDISGEDNYEVYRCTSTVTSSCGTAISAPTGNSYDDFEASAGVLYHYRIKACSAAGGCSGFSNHDSGRRQAQVSPPPTPGAPSASDDLYPDRVRVTWSDAMGEDNYEVYRCTTTATGSCGSAIATPAGTGFVDFGAAVGVAYYYRIKACNAGGCSGLSAYDTGRIGGAGGEQIFIDNFESPAGPDLAPSDFQIGTTALSVGEPVSIIVTVGNIGNSTSESTHVRYKLSADSSISDADETLASSSIAGLNGGSTSTDSVDLSIANAGDYWLGACVDPVSGESDVSNNCSSAILVTVENATDGPPTISRVNPSTISATFAPDTNIDFTVDVADSDGDLAWVDYYVDGSPSTNISVSGASDQATWTRSFSSAGIYNIGAVAMDSRGQTSEIAWEITIEDATDPVDNVTGTIRILSGDLAGQAISDTDWEIAVSPGASISGSLLVETDNFMGSGAVAPLGYTWTWGGRETALASVNGDIPTGVSSRSVNIALTAPTEPGTYHILFGFNGEFSLSQVFSCDNWSAGGGVVWNDGNDYHDLSNTEIQEAVTNGFVSDWVYRFSSGYQSRAIPAAAIRVVVEEAAGSSECYREDATVANSCGGVSGGSYSSNGFWNDGSFDDNFTLVDNSGHFVTYVKPAGATGARLRAKYYVWQDSHVTNEQPIPAACWSEGNTVQIWIRQNLSDPRCGGNFQGQYCLYLDCYDGNTWSNRVMGSGSVSSSSHFNKIYEEAIIWEFQ